MGELRYLKAVSFVQTPLHPQWLKPATALLESMGDMGWGSLKLQWSCILGEGRRTQPVACRIHSSSPRLISALGPHVWPDLSYLCLSFYISSLHLPHPTFASMYWQSSAWYECKEEVTLCILSLCDWGDSFQCQTWGESVCMDPFIMHKHCVHELVIALRWGQVQRACPFTLHEFSQCMEGSNDQQVSFGYSKLPWPKKKQNTVS